MTMAALPTKNFRFQFHFKDWYSGI